MSVVNDQTSDVHKYVCVCVRFGCFICAVHVAEPGASRLVFEFECESANSAPSCPPLWSLGVSDQRRCVPPHHMRRHSHASRKVTDHWDQALHAGDWAVLVAVRVCERGWSLPRRAHARDGQCALQCDAAHAFRESMKMHALLSRGKGV